MERIEATYHIETPLDLETAANSLAGEQSSGTFVKLPRETEDLKLRFAARVEQIRPLDQVSVASLPGHWNTRETYHRAEVTISWSADNMGTNLPTLVSTIQGNLYELAQFSGLKLMDLRLPASFSDSFRGPNFGVEGCRKLMGVDAGPMIGTIIKPSIGMSPKQTADLVKELVEAGVDFIKDDELMANPPHSPFNERVDAIMPVILQHAARTGKKVMYAFNISDEMDAMHQHYDKIVISGGTCAMISINSVGLSGVKQICDRGELAIHAHRNGWGMLNRHPMLGVDFNAYQTLWRLAGVDQIHVNGIDNKFWEPDDSVVRSIEACRKPLLGGMSVLPVVSSGQWGGQACETYQCTRTTDLLYMAGGGIMAHPEGPAAGVRSLRKWWEAAVEGCTMTEAVCKYPELRVSLEKFGKRS